MFKYSFALIIAMLLLSMPVYAHDTLNIQNGNQVHGDGDKENCHYHYYTTDDGHIAWEQSVIDTWIPDAQDDIDGGTYVDEELPDIIIPENDDGDAPRPVSLNPSPVTENIIHNHSVACKNGYRLTNHGGDGGWHSHSGIIRGTAGNGIVYTPEYLRLHNEKTPCIETPAPILSAPIAESVGKSVESTPITRHTAVAQCPVGWSTGSPQAIIGAIGFEWIVVEGRGHYNITSVEIYTQQPETDLSGMRLQIKAMGSQQMTEIALNAPTNAFGFLRVGLPSPVRMNTAGFDLMGFDVRLLTPEGNRRIDTATACYPKHIDRQTFREAGRIERIIPKYDGKVYGMDADISSLLGSEWNDFYRSEWKVIGVAAAPSPHRTLTGMWAQLKKR